MKKIIFSIIGSMVFSLCAVQAQQHDTTGTASQSRERQQQRQQYDQQREQARQQRDQRRTERQAWRQQSDQYRGGDEANQGMVIVSKNEIPEQLKETLKKDKYEGWEDGTIYHNTNTGEYVIAPRAYRFDENGKEIEFNSTGYGDRRGQRSDQPSSGYRQSDRPSDQSGDQSSTQRSGDRSDQNNKSVHDEAGQYSNSRSSEMPSDQYPATEQDNERKAGEQQPSNSYQAPSNTQQQSDDQRSTDESQSDNSR